MISEEEAVQKIYAEVNSTIDGIRRRHKGTDKEIIQRLSEEIDHREAEELQPELGHLFSQINMLNLLEIPLEKRDEALEALVDQYCEIFPDS